MSQSRTHSAYEALINVVVGFSILRSYTLRRAFNRLHRYQRTLEEATARDGLTPSQQAAASRSR